MKNRLINRITLLAAVLPLLILSACFNRSTLGSAGSHTVNEHFRSDWAKDGMWDQGVAEVAKYEAERVVYDQVREFEYVYVLVKETFNEEFNVKTDDYERNDLFEVMKVNKFAHIPTQRYPYHYLTSLFYKREYPDRLYKLTNTSQEWCGNTAKMFLDQGNQYQFSYNSYWDGQGVGETTTPGDILFEDQLTYSLRALKFTDGLTFNAKVAESQVTSKATPPKIYEATFTVTQEADAQALGAAEVNTSEPVWKVTVALENGKNNTYWFKNEYPNLLLKQTTWDGRDLLLKSVEMSAYWNV